jgi:two-component system alkaline phosphatase synthesis response regulator PhoP
VRTKERVVTATPPLDRTVLVVEDERAVRDILERYLLRAGLSVVLAPTGDEALHELARAHPDLVLLDLGLPDMDGTEVLRAATPGTPVVVLSGRGQPADRIAGLAAGASDYVTKPFSPTEVVLRVLAVLGLPRGSPR